MVSVVLWETTTGMSLHERTVRVYRTLLCFEEEVRQQRLVCKTCVEECRVVDLTVTYLTSP